VLGDDDAVEADFSGPLHHQLGGHDAVERVAAGVQVQIELHRC
jgi:hypothetical protein